MKTGSGAIIADISCNSLFPGQRVKPVQIGALMHISARNKGLKKFRLQGHDLLLFLLVSIVSLAAKLYQL